MKPTLILLPGLSGTSTLMQWITPLLAPHYELCLAELPASTNKGDQNYQTLCQHIEQTYLTKYSETTSIWILAESFSGPIAIMLAKRHPENIHGIILAATFATCPNNLAKQLQKLLFTLLPLRLGRKKAAPIFLAGTKWLTASQTMKHQIKLALSNTPVPTLIERLHTVFTCDLSHLFPLKQPVLYLQAKHDWIVYSHALRTIQALQPHLKHQRFNAPHLILQFNASESAKAIHHFIKTHD